MRCKDHPKPDQTPRGGKASGRAIGTPQPQLVTGRGGNPEE